MKLTIDHQGDLIISVPNYHHPTPTPTISSSITIRVRRTDLPRLIESSAACLQSVVAPPNQLLLPLPLTAGDDTEPG